MIVRQPDLFGAGGTTKGRLDEGLLIHRVGGEWLGALGVLIHHARQKLLIQAAPIDADANGFVVTAGDLDHLRKLGVAFAAATDVARVDAQFGQGFGALGVLGQQFVTIEVKIPDQRHT